MGGTWIEETLSLLQSHIPRLLAFPGITRGSPRSPRGDPDRIAEDCRAARAARAATTGRLVVAGSITGTDQIQALAAAGIDAFTIGSAAFDGSQ